MADGIKARNRMANSVSRAADEAASVDMRRRLRKLEKAILADRTADSDGNVDADIQKLCDELGQYARQNQVSVAEKCIERIELLLTRRKAQGGKKMGLFDRIMGRGGKKEKPSKLDSTLEQTDQKLFELEKQVAVLAEKRQQEVDRLRDYVSQGAQMDRESLDYKQLRARAVNTRSQIGLYDGQINKYYNALMDSERYRQLIDNGLTMKNLASLLPDPVEAEMLLEELSMHVTDVHERQLEFTGALKAYDERTPSGVQVLESEDDEFDREVEALRKTAVGTGEEAAPAAQPEPAQPEAPRESPEAAELKKLRAQIEAANQEKQRAQAEAEELKKLRAQVEAAQREKQRAQAEAEELKKLRAQAEAAEHEKQRAQAEAEELKKLRAQAEAAEREKQLAQAEAEKLRKLSAQTKTGAEQDPYAEPEEPSIEEPPMIEEF